jgi:predicted secreted protein
VAKRAVGTKIEIAGSSISEVTSIGGLELSAETIDVTTLDSDGGYRKFIGGFKDGGEVPVSGFFNPLDTTGQMAMYNAYESGAEIPFVINFPPELGASWIFNGVVTGFSTSAELEEAIPFEATIKVSGKPTLATSPSVGLSSLSITGAGGALAPAFVNSNSNYSFGGVTAPSITVTATAAAHTIRLFVNGVYIQDLGSGSPSSPIPLTLNAGKKVTIVAFEAGKGQKVYEIVAIKSA